MSHSPVGGAVPAGADELRAWLVTSLAALAPDFTRPIDDDTPLAEGGLCLGSVDLMELSCAIEERLGVALSESDVTPENFGTVARLLVFLESVSGRP